MSISEQIENLNKAKLLVKDDPSNYIQIVPGIIPVASRPETEFRQWCASFFLDCFTCDELDTETKKSLAVSCLDPLLLLITQQNDQVDDWITVKLSINCCSCVYPLIFSYVCSNSGESIIWNKITELKTQILNKWNDDPNSSTSSAVHFGIQASCIKFAQVVIYVQTYCSRDPRMMSREDDSGKSEEDDISLALVPPGHPLIEAPTIEAQGLGLLDRMLSIFSEPNVYAPTITCTLNALYQLIRTRPSSIPKILRSVLNFDTNTKNIVTNANAANTPAISELEIKFIDKCLKLFLTNIIKRNVAPKFSSQIQRYLTDLSELRGREKLKKRVGEAAEQKDEKRVKLEYRSGSSGVGSDNDNSDNSSSNESNRKNMPANASTKLPSGPVSFSSLFNLINSNDPLASFDAKELPKDIAINIALASIALSNEELLDNSINIIRKRYERLVESSKQFGKQQQSQQHPLKTSLDASYDDEDEDVDSIVAAQTAESDALITADMSDDDDDKDALLLPTSSFALALPNKLTPDQRKTELGQIVDRLISYSSISTTILSSGAAKANKGLNRVAVTDWNKDTWVIIASRLATRGACNSDSVEAKTVIRKHIFNYVISNFRDRLEIIISWLTEEWFNEYANNNNSNETINEEESIYYKWTTDVFDHIIPLIESDDAKGFIRLLSDLPSLNRTLIFKLRSLCVDPLRSKIGFMSIRYLIKLKPPVKEFCLDLLQDLYITEQDTQKVAGAILKPYRSEFLLKQENVEVN